MLNFLQDLNRSRYLFWFDAAGDAANPRRSEVKNSGNLEEEVTKVVVVVVVVQVVRIIQVTLAISAIKKPRRSVHIATHAACKQEPQEMHEELVSIGSNLLKRRN